jgi:phytoene synthase
MLLPEEDRRTQLPGIIMGNIYYDLLLQIEQGNLTNILNEKTQLTPVRKLWITILSILKINIIK